jgi:DNA polymerase III alpha subunit
MKLSDLDLDIPSTQSNNIKNSLPRASIINDKGDLQPHPAGVYFYKNIPSYDGISLLNYKDMESKEYQKIDILNNTYLDKIESAQELEHYVGIIEKNNIDWKKLWEYDEPYQLSKYPGILREFKVESVIDIAIVMAIIRPGSLQNYEKMKTYMHTDTLLNKKNEKEKEILCETYGVAVFAEQFVKLGKDDGKYRYKKPHAIGYAYVLLIDFLKNV